MSAPALGSRGGLAHSHSRLSPKTAAALQQNWLRSVAAPVVLPARKTECRACSRRCMQRSKRNNTVRAVQGTQLPGELRGSSAEDLPEALPPPVQPFAVILGAGPTGAFMALLLAQQGWRVNVYDSRPRPGNAWDAHTMAHAQNVVLGRRAQLCLARADALGQVEDCSVRLLGQITVGQWVQDASVRYPFAALSISEPDLAGALVRLGQKRHPQQIRYHFGHRCTAVDFSSHGANFVDESSSFADLVASSAVFIKKSPPADLLIGADGPRSAMRSAMQSQTPMFGFSQVFSTREVHKALRVCPASSQVDCASESSSAAPAWAPRWRRGGALQLTQALYTLQRQLDGQPITCQLLPNRDGSFAMSVRGQGLISCSTVLDCERLFQTAFPQVVEALGMGTDTYQEFVSAPLSSEPLISCSRYHHNNAVLLGSAAHATFPDMHVSASAGLEDCVSLADALREHGSGSPAVRRAAQAMTAARRPAALAAARLAAYTATPKDPLSQALSGLRFHVLLACSSSLGSTGLLPWELKLLSSDQDPRLIHSWRSQDALIATAIVLGAAVVITWGSSGISSHVFGSPALSDVLDAAVQSTRGAVSSLPRLWAAILAALIEGRRAFAAALQSP